MNSWVKAALATTAILIVMIGGLFFVSLLLAAGKNVLIHSLGVAVVLLFLSIKYGWFND